MTDRSELVRPLLRTRQIREFTDEPISEEDLNLLADVARWSGSGSNVQPWRFIVIREEATLRTIAEAGMPQTRSLRSAAAGIAIALREEQEAAISHAYDEGRAAERILVGAQMLGLGAGIAWIPPANRGTVGELLHIPGEWRVRTVVAIGHPSESARKPKSAPGQARLPRNEVVFPDRWPAG